MSRRLGSNKSAPQKQIEIKSFQTAENVLKYSYMDNQNNFQGSAPNNANPFQNLPPVVPMTMPVAAPAETPAEATQPVTTTSQASITDTSSQLASESDETSNRSKLQTIVIAVAAAVVFGLIGGGIGAAIGASSSTPLSEEPTVIVSNYPPKFSDAEVKALMGKYVVTNSVIGSCEMEHEELNFRNFNETSKASWVALTLVYEGDYTSNSTDGVRPEYYYEVAYDLFNHKYSELFGGQISREDYDFSASSIDSFSYKDNGVVLSIHDLDGSECVDNSFATRRFLPLIANDEEIKILLAEQQQNLFIAKNAIDGEGVATRADGTKFDIYSLDFAKVLTDSDGLKLYEFDFTKNDGNFVLSNVSQV